MLERKRRRYDFLTVVYSCYREWTDRWTFGRHSRPRNRHDPPLRISSVKKSDSCKGLFLSVECNDYNGLVHFQEGVSLAVLANS
jgi:hypothetical protein